MFGQFATGAFDPVPHAGALLVAYLLALPIGWNREKAERTAGLRTFPLVAVASCGFVEAAESMSRQSPEALARIIEGTIVGMGFIGGGAILRHKESVRGTATAASLWVTGAIGVAVGLGSLDVADPGGGHICHALDPLAAQGGRPRRQASAGGLNALPLSGGESKC